MLMRAIYKRNELEKTQSNRKEIPTEDDWKKKKKERKQIKKKSNKIKQKATEENHRFQSFCITLLFVVVCVVVCVAWQNSRQLQAFHSKKYQKVRA